MTYRAKEHYRDPAVAASYDAERFTTRKGSVRGPTGTGARRGCRSVEPVSALAHASWMCRAGPAGWRALWPMKATSSPESTCRKPCWRRRRRDSMTCRPRPGRLSSWETQRHSRSRTRASISWCPCGCSGTCPRRHGHVRFSISAGYPEGTSSSRYYQRGSLQELLRRRRRATTPWNPVDLVEIDAELRAAGLRRGSRRFLLPLISETVVVLAEPI